MRGLQSYGLAFAHDFDDPLLLLVVELGRFADSFCPVIQFHHFGIHFQPISDFVFWAENWPVIREWQIWHVVIPNRVMQAERLVTVAPGIPRLFVFLDDDGGNPQAPHTRAKPYATLTATDYQTIGLGLVTEFAFFHFALFKPGGAVFHGTMHNPLATR